MKIVVLDGYTENPGDISWAPLESLGDLTVYDRTPEDKIAARIGEAEVVIVNKVPISRQTMETCAHLRYIGVLATGYNIIDTQAAEEKGIIVTNIPTYGTASVAQFVFALLLEICHHVGAHSSAVMSGEWEKAPDWCFWKYPLIELAGKTMGIIGFGRIGQAAAAIAQAFGMYVLTYDERVNPALESEKVKYTSLDDLLARSDIISLHCPLLPSTKEIINESSIAKMKPGAILINTSRGPLVNEKALAEALKSKKLYAAAVDVVSSEPMRPDNPLLGLENCLITPHIAWAPKESRLRLMNIAAENLKAFQDGRPINTVH